MNYLIFCVVKASSYVEGRIKIGIVEDCGFSHRCIDNGRPKKFVESVPIPCKETAYMLYHDQID